MSDDLCEHDMVLAYCALCRRPPPGVLHRVHQEIAASRGFLLTDDQSEVANQIFEGGNYDVSAIRLAQLFQSCLLDSEVLNYALPTIWRGGAQGGGPSAARKRFLNAGLTAAVARC